MKRLTLVVAFLVAGSALAQVRVQVQLPSIFFPAPPSLVLVEPGVQVVQDYDEEVFYVDNFYWHRRGDYWYRTNTHNGQWVQVEPRFVPQRLSFYEPGHFRHWRGSDDQRREWNEWRERHEDRHEVREREERFEHERLERDRFEHERGERERFDREHREGEHHSEERREDRRDDRREQRGGYVVPPPSGNAAPPPNNNYHRSEPAGGEHGSGPAGSPPPKKRGNQPIVH